MLFATLTASIQSQWTATHLATAGRQPSQLIFVLFAANNHHYNWRNSCDRRPAHHELRLPPRCLRLSATVRPGPGAKRSNSLCGSPLRLCGYPHGSLSFLSSGNVMLLTLVTDEEKNFPGFRANYSQIPLTEHSKYRKYRLSAHHSRQIVYTRSEKEGNKFLLVSNGKLLSLWALTGVRKSLTFFSKSFTPEMNFLFEPFSRQSVTTSKPFELKWLMKILTINCDFYF